jgi:hypothetical protein
MIDLHTFSLVMEFNLWTGCGLKKGYKALAITKYADAQPRLDHFQIVRFVKILKKKRFRLSGVGLLVKPETISPLLRKRES